MNNFEKIDILLVEDNPYDAELSLRALQKKKLVNNVEWVQDGADALDFLFCAGVYANRPKGELPRLILLDIKLPRVSGIEVLRRIKADPETRSIPVVMLTSSAEVQDLSECYQLGVNSYIVKPVEFESFQEEVEKAGFYWMLVNKVPAS
ncbi:MULTISPECIES: response regulator [unclassified Herbaspirillum]|jgi:CheY-like chemotaxis protein|uniref:response regulator n=1 Tax=unclassified Herbaspirillum TaxID=2624150 RepID=UPI000E2EE890|nr:MULTISPECIES: response regulator [unclassified Herbaspirillum]RFB73329.1 response regulator [Herbaspirillum sp. 3R-3a1]TFI10865.1 response regulator [Herbaspirillum sp. 3R11]TFI16774.1 response regulator [Herbaspirillum sp. 3R-11]TFI29296.1 response regulator [Herbaspirillum sp. 3C11]